MKRKRFGILGVALTQILLGSLLLSAAPVSAGTLFWSTETIPSTTGNVLAKGNQEWL